MKLPCHHLLALALNIDKDEVKSAEVNSVISSASFVVSILQRFVNNRWLSISEPVSGSGYRKIYPTRMTRKMRSVTIQSCKNGTKLAVLILIRTQSVEVKKKAKDKFSAATKQFLCTS